MAEYEKSTAAVVAISAPASETGKTKSISERSADVTLRFIKEYGSSAGQLTPEKEKRLRWKLYFHVMTLLILINLMLFIDKSTLSYSTLLGVFDETHINNSQYNNLNTFFYVGYIIAQAPGHYLMQRLPLGRFVAVTVFIWSIIIFLHCTAKDYGGLIVLRLLLGVFEACLLPAMEITLGMFFPPIEQGRLQPVFWISCVAAPIPSGFIAYGLLHSTSRIRPWKFFMIITGGLTLILAVYSWFFYPDNPVKARFLTLEEKVHAAQRVHEATRSSIEQKQFKWYQFWETLRDPVSWLFTLQPFMLMLSNNLYYQQNLLFLDIGVSDLGSTLVGVAGGGFAVVCCIIATILFRLFPNNNAYWGTFWCLPAVAGGIGMVTVPWHKKISLLACLTLAATTYGVTYITALGWTTSSAAGYTKKLTRNVLFMAGYGIANLVGPQIWVAHDAPRYYAAWIVQIVISWVGAPIILLIIRWILARRNEERRVWIAEQDALGRHATGIVEQLDESGRAVEVEAEVSLLDLTDLENKYFLYPL
ncbi:hypothetical protein DTO217A2_788 [Paecilomyces variotii]|nr:hypothetical protein DTO217A2_788 [Paecilomyces variotii]KAJ9371537.1 hypothetical protein DTO282E5_3719 [Paecilomyces variotii]KAJ9397899.1 hypothetical protein DTO282F9_5218 [Paecilomyces variotii]